VIALWLAAALAMPATPKAVPPLRPRATPVRIVAPATMLARYAAALAANPTPSVLSFEYSVDQAGPHDIQETHRVFRSGNSERDELLTADGKTLNPPTIHIFLGHRNRYAIEVLAPRPEAYTFRYLTSVRDGHHLDQVFATKPRSAGDVSVKRVILDGVTALPVTITLATRRYDGDVIVTFGKVQKYWMALSATATATTAKSLAIEHLAFSRYRFPTSLAASTFSTPRPLPSFRPAPY
jgi:hypothetical protein